MIISHAHKFIYFKAQKVAGTSTEILLEKFCPSDDIVTPISKGDSESHRPRNFKNFYNHISAQEVRGIIGSHIFENYFKFMTVRNPWDRVVSLYFFQRRTSYHKPDFKSWLCSQNSSVLYPLSRWSDIDSDCIIDDFIQYENLEEDTRRILNKVGIIGANFAYPRAKANFRPSNTHYREYYDSETKKIVATRYKKDIEDFGYNF